MEFEQKCKDIENLYLTEVIRDKSNFWEHIFELVRKNEGFVFEKINIYKLGRILIDNLLNHGTDDFTTVKRVMETYALAMGWNSICQGDRRITFSGILNPSNGFNRLHERCVFSGLRLLECAFGSQDVKVMTLLVKYGLFQISPGDSLIVHDSSELQMAFDGFCSASYYIHEIRLEFEMPWIDVANTYVNQLNEINCNFRRIQLIIRVLDVMRCMMLGCETENYIKCIKLYFETVTDPFVTKREINLFLRYLFRDEPSQDEADYLSDDYAILFAKEALGPLEPRRLMHLCRCSIRQAISKNSGFLPDAVKDLHIPCSLKSYILVK